MSDNTTTNPGAAGDVIATDDLTTLNGAGSANVKVQRVKVGFGDDGDCRDASTAFPLPTKLMAGDSAGALLVGTVQQQTLVKGTQGSRGVMAQALKDSGRTLFTCSTAIGGVAGVNAEALIAMDTSRRGVGSVSETSHAVTAGKILRITGIYVSIRATGAAVFSCRFGLRFNPTAAVTTASQLLLPISLSSAPAVAEQGNERWIELPDGMEFSGTDQFGLTQVCNAAAGQVYAALTGFEY